MQYKIGIFGIILFVLSSCALHQGNLSSNATITNNNFRIIGTAIGKSSAFYFLGIGGLKKDALVYAAKNNLYKNYPLKSGQALTSITIDFKREFYIIFFKTNVTITAEIIDFNPSDQLGQENNNKNIYEIQRLNGFNVGDSVYIKENNKYRLGKISKIDIENLYVQFIDFSKEQKITKNADFSKVFGLTGTFNFKGKTYTTGDKIHIETITGETPSGNQKIKVFDGAVLGISKNKALLYSDKNKSFKEISVKR